MPLADAAGGLLDAVAWLTIIAVNGTGRDVVTVNTVMSGGWRARIAAAILAVLTALAFLGIVRAASISDLTVGSATVAPSTSVTINITATADDLGSYRVDVHYDSSLVSATACTSTYGVCSIDIVATDTVRVNGATISGITGTNVVLGTITFLAGPTDGTAALTVNPATLIVADPGGDSLVVAPTNGAITILTSGSGEGPNTTACEKSMASSKAAASAKANANERAVVHCK